MKNISKVIQWLIGNKEWVFSGVGLACIGVIDRIIKRRKNHDSKITINQVDKGNHNTQIGVQNNYNNYKGDSDG